MQPLDPRAVAAEIAALQDALAAERFRHVAGLEPAPSLDAIFREHGAAAHRETIGALRAAGEEELAAAVGALRAGRVAAEDEEAWRAAESGATGHGPDGPVALEEAALRMVREADRGRRREWGRAILDGAQAARGAREGAAEKRSRALSEMGLAPDPGLVAEGLAWLSESDDAYCDVLGWLAQREMGAAPGPRGDLARPDLLHLMTLRPVEGLFPRGSPALALGRVAKGLGIPLSGIRLDDAGRPTQWAGAHALGTRVSFRRRGGPGDFIDLFAATGRAAAHAANRGFIPVLPQSHSGAGSASPAGQTSDIDEHRHGTGAGRMDAGRVVPGSTVPGPDPAFPWILGSLLAGLWREPLFLAHELELDRSRVPDVVRMLALRELFTSRAAAAALTVAVELERGASGARWAEQHRDAMTRAGMAAWPLGLAARDSEVFPLAAALLGAAGAEALRTGLRQRFDEDYWRNPRIRDAMGGMLAAGRAEPGAEDRSHALRAIISSLS